MPFVTVSLYQSAQSILTQFSGSLQQRALANFKATGINVRLNVAVTEVTRDTIKLKAKDSDEVETIPYGQCVWSTGEFRGQSSWRENMTCRCTAAELLMMISAGRGATHWCGLGGKWACRVGAGTALSSESLCVTAGRSWCTWHQHSCSQAEHDEPARQPGWCGLECQLHLRLFWPE